MNTPVRLHIDRLVLDGISLGPGEAERFQAALVETLGDLLRVEGVGATSSTSAPVMAGDGQRRPPLSLMAELDPATHAPSVPQRGGTGAGWVAGSSPAMTEGGAGTESTPPHGNRSTLRGPTIATTTSPTALGQAVARAVHASLTTQPRDGGRT